MVEYNRDKITAEIVQTLRPIINIEKVQDQVKELMIDQSKL